MVLVNDKLDQRLLDLLLCGIRTRIPCFYTGGIAIMLSTVIVADQPVLQELNLHFPFGYPPGSHGPNPDLVFSAFPFATGPAYFHSVVGVSTPRKSGRPYKDCWDNR